MLLQSTQSLDKLYAPDVETVMALVKQMMLDRVKFLLEATGTILLCGIVSIFSSCNGQSNSEGLSGTLESQNMTITVGSTVSELGKGVMVVYQDKTDNLWFGSKGQGVYKYDGESLSQFTIKDGLSSNHILGIQEDNLGNIYFETGDGIDKFNGRSIYTLEVMDATMSNTEWRLTPGDLWFRLGWNGAGPYRYDGKSLYQLKFPKHHLEDEFYARYPDASFSPYGIYTIYKDRKGNVWFGTATLGACRYDGESLAWISEEELTELDAGPAPGVRSILEDKDGNIWFSNNILHRYNVVQESSPNQRNEVDYKRLGEIDISREDNLNSHCMSIAEDKNGNLWIVTYMAGVWRYDGESLTHFPIKDGKRNIELFSIYEDKHDVLWLGTHNDGVYRYNGEVFERFEPVIANE